MGFRRLCRRKGGALNYIAVGVVTVFPLLPCPIVATDQAHASDQLSQTSVSAGASDLDRGSGQSWGRWLDHVIPASGQKAGREVPQSAVASSTELEADLRRRQRAISMDENLDRKEEEGLQRCMEPDSSYCGKSLPDHYDGSRSGL